MKLDFVYSKQGITIRPILRSDFEVFSEIYSSPKMMKYLGNPITENEMPAFFGSVYNDVSSNSPKQIIWSIKNEQDAIVIGFVGIVFSQRGGDDGNLGIMIKPRTAIKGTAKIAMELFMDHLFEKTETKVIRSQTAVANKAAYFAAKSVGFSFLPLPESHKKNDIRHGIILKENWKLANYV